MVRIGYLAVAACIAVSLSEVGCAAPQASGSRATESGAGGDALHGAATGSCAGVSDEERTSGVFAHRAAVVSVDPVRRATWPKVPEQLAGAAISLRATPGMTEQWLGRVFVCHEAFAAASGTATADAFQGATLSVASTRLGFRVELTTPDRDRAQTILESARTLSRL